jgi:L-lysine 2,3-aminomutase
MRVSYAKIGKFAWTKGGFMGVTDILASVDREIALLQQARALLSGVAAPAPKKKAGRPKKKVVAVTPAPLKSAKKVAKKKKRNLSPEGRKRIAEAVKRRWEAQKKATSGSK